MDFAAIDKTMKLKAFNLNEFCLCAADEDATPPLPPPPLLTSTLISTQPVSVRASYLNDIQGINLLNRKSPPPPMMFESFVSDKSVPSNIGTPALLRNDSFATVRIRLTKIFFKCKIHTMKVKKNYLQFLVIFYYSTILFCIVWNVLMQQERLELSKRSNEERRDVKKTRKEKRRDEKKTRKGKRREEKTIKEKKKDN